ncbi:hypothetical protein Cgig2_015389 [Carnegiea gigantea]|uniref:Uncharacterized protein n=1 Tax=Carnegiea gigantea TaxID=171969 RepID=A0A9Q1Q5S6_9CARY|nr:hypothetical protein Cgig2_015389 [Carnegiea gigantea]
MHADESLVFQVLKARYFLDLSMMNATLGHRLSFTWRSLCGAKWVVKLRARCLVGDGFSLNILDSKWIPRPSLFNVITPFNPNFSLLWVADLIDRERGDLRHDMVDAIFLPIDEQAIKQIPLCSAWPPDRIMWHYSDTGALTVRSAYHAIRRGQVPSPSGVVQLALQFVWEYGEANCSLNGVTNLTSSGWTKPD